MDVLRSRFESETTASRNLVSLMNSLAAHLEMHFEMEEEHEYFGYVLNRAPRLSAQVNQLLLQHETLKTEVHHLVTIARKTFAESGNVAKLATRFDRFRKQLLDHERVEVNLLQEASRRDLGSGTDASC